MWRELVTRFLFASALFFVSQSAVAAGIVNGAGLTCTSPNGEVMRLNIDLERGRYDAGDGVKRLDRVTDTKIIIEGDNPDLLTSPLGPIFHSLELDRVTLMLTDRTLVPNRNVNNSTKYQCIIGSLIDFTASRRF